MLDQGLVNKISTIVESYDVLKDEFITFTNHVKNPMP